MPPRRTLTPPPLEELCLVAVMKHLENELLLCSQVQRYQHSSLLLRRRGIDAESLVAELQCHLDCLPPLLSEMVRQRMANKLMKNSESMANSPGLLVGMLNIVLNRQVKNLEIGNRSLRYDVDVWRVILKKCTGLERFVLGTNTSKIGASSVQPFITMLTSNCPMLTELVLRDAVRNSRALSVIGRSCHRLRILDITGSKVGYSNLVHLFVYLPSKVPATVTWEQLNPLCQTLEVLLLHNTSVRAKGAELVLAVAPNITSLGNFVFLASGLKRLHRLKSYPWAGHKLKHAFYRGPSDDKLQLLASSCPVLESLHVGSVTPRRIHFSNFSAFKRLMCLTLENIHFEDILAGLRHTPQLLELEISSTGVDFGVVGQCCPLLKKLTVSEEPSQTVTLTNAMAPIYSDLQELKMMCTVSLECGAMFFTSATKLRSIEIIRIQGLTDNILSRWLKINPLQLLEVLLLRYVKLTKKSVHLLLECCPRLTRLGELGSWDVRSWECRRLKTLVEQEKYALHLEFYTSTNIDISDILTESSTSDDADMDEQ